MTSTSPTPLTLTSVIGNALDPSAAAPSGAQDGATPFAQLLDQYAAPLPGDTGSASVPVSVSTTESIDESEATDAAQTPAGDTALIAALLEQLQMPYLRATAAAEQQDNGDAAAGSASDNAAAARPLLPAAPGVSAQALAASSVPDAAADAAAPDVVRLTTLTAAVEPTVPETTFAPVQTIAPSPLDVTPPPADAAKTTPGIVLPPTITAGAETAAAQRPLDALADPAAQVGDRVSLPRADDGAAVAPKTSAVADATPQAHAGRAANAHVPNNSATPTAEELNVELAPQIAAQSVAQLTPARARLTPAQPGNDAINTGINAATFAYQTTQQTAAATTATTPSVNIAPPLDTPEWKPAFATGMRSLVQDGLNSASLQLNPAELGPVDVRIVMSEQRADISFVVKSAEANQAIQSALPDLREQLARSGIELGQTSVGGQRGDTRSHGDNPRRQATPRASATDALGSVTAAPNAPRPRSLGQIDTFA